MKVLSLIRRYGLAAISCGLALAVAWPLDAPSSCFFLAVIISSLYGGRGPGLLAVGLSCLAFDYFFLPPRFHFFVEPSFDLRFGAFLGATLLVATLIGAKQRVDKARLQIAAQVQRSEAYLVAGQRLSHTGSWAFNVASGELFWSQETFRIFGFDPTRTGTSLEMFLQRIHPEDRPRIEQGINDAAMEARDYAADYRIVLPDGSIKYIHDVVYTVANPDGQIVERYGVIMDMTERKVAEEERERSFDQLRALTARVQSAREEERSRLAREIHDELGQALTAIKIDLSAWVYDLRPEERQSDKAASILKLVDQTIRTVRKISTELRPGILDDLGLVAAIEWAAEEFEARTGTQCRLSLSDFDIPIDRERDTALFRIFQETLTNVARHARATCVDVAMTKSTENVTLEVQDDGCGTSPEKLSAPLSLGIRGMRERALLLGGELTIRSFPGEGTTVRATLPLRSCSSWS